MLLRKSFFALLFIIVLSSCTSKQDINIDSSGKGSCTVSVELNSFFIDYLKDLSDAVGSDSDDFNIFEKSMIENSFKQYSDAELVDVRISGIGKLEVGFSFNNPEEILKDNNINPILKYSRNANTSLLSFNLNSDNYPALSRMIGLADNPVLSALTPQPENPYTNDEYLDMLDFVFSDYEGGDMAAMTVAKSIVGITVKTDGRIIRAENGKSTGNTVVFEIPLLKFLTLAEPVKFLIEYK